MTPSPTFHHVCAKRHEFYSKHPIAHACPVCAHYATMLANQGAKRALTAIPGEGERVRVLRDPTEDYQPGVMFSVLEFTETVKLGYYPAAMECQRGSTRFVVGEIYERAGIVEQS